jgi:hypothetical protein
MMILRRSCFNFNRDRPHIGVTFYFLKLRTPVFHRSSALTEGAAVLGHIDP